MADIIKSLCEWEPSSVLDKIPTKIQKGLFFTDINITCLDISDNFIGLGTDAGIVFWYNRENYEVQKLKCEFSASITCIKIISSVEYMIAVGNSTGQVGIFQIPKKHPPDIDLLLQHQTELKPIQRYTIRESHHTFITSVEWSRNGMKLFSGDRNGIIVLTEFDYQCQKIKSYEILNEAYEIVQLSFRLPWLLISTVYRVIICEKSKDETTGNTTTKWNVSQIGKKDRKILSDFGAIFIGDPRNPQIICTRPGFRFWLSDITGNVLQTFLFKEILTKPTYEIPILNPRQFNVNNAGNMVSLNFGKIYQLTDSIIITHTEQIIYFLNLDKLKVEATVKRLRRILNLIVNKKSDDDFEIFILEGPRSIVRIAGKPDTIGKFGQLRYRSTTSHESIYFKPIEYEAEDQPILNAEECFELPPIEHIQLDIPLHTSYSEDNLPLVDKLFLEHSRKIKIFEKINMSDYDDDAILYSDNSGKPKSKIKENVVQDSDKAGSSSTSGIVEIGQSIEDDINFDKTNKKLLNTTPKKTSFSILPDLRSPQTINKELIEKEQILSTKLNIEPVILENLSVKTSENFPLTIPVFPYPYQFTGTDTTPLSVTTNSITTTTTTITTTSTTTTNTLIKPTVNSNLTPLKKIFFLNDDIVPEGSAPTISDLKLNYLKNLSDDMKNVMIKSDVTDLRNLNGCSDCVPVSLCQQNQQNTTRPKFMTKSIQSTSSNGVTDIRSIPDFMHLPNLWNVTIEKYDVDAGVDDRIERERTDSTGEWEIVDI